MKFTFVIPAYNEEKFIQKTLESLYPQAVPQEEYSIVVVNNNSTDKTKQVIEQFAQNHSAKNIIVVDQEEKGIIPARQAGVEYAISTFGKENHWIVNGDADTTYTRDWLKNLTQCIKNNPECEFIQCIAGGDNLEDYPNVLKATQEPKDKTNILLNGNKYNPVDDKVCAYTANLYRTTGGYTREYDENGVEQMAETWRLFIKAKLLGFKRAFCEKNISMHSNRRTLEQFLELELGGEEFDKLYTTDIRGDGENKLLKIEQNTQEYITKDVKEKIFLEKIRVRCFSFLVLKDKSDLVGEMKILNQKVDEYMRAHGHRGEYMEKQYLSFKDSYNLTQHLKQELLTLADSLNNS